MCLARARSAACRRHMQGPSQEHDDEHLFFLHTAEISSLTEARLDGDAAEAIVFLLTAGGLFCLSVQNAMPDRHPCAAAQPSPRRKRLLEHAFETQNATSGYPSNKLPLSCDPHIP